MQFWLDVEELTDWRVTSTSAMTADSARTAMTMTVMVGFREDSL